MSYTTECYSSDSSVTTYIVDNICTVTTSQQICCH